MKERIKYITTDKIILWSSFGSSLFFFLSVFIILFSFRFLPPLIPLFNQLPWGESRLGDKSNLLWPLGLIFFISVGNIILAGSLYPKLPLVARILCLTAFLIGFLSLLFISRTILLVLY